MPHEQHSGECGLVGNWRTGGTILTIAVFLLAIGTARGAAAGGEKERWSLEFRIGSIDSINDNAGALLREDTEHVGNLLLGWWLGPAIGHGRMGKVDVARAGQVHAGVREIIAENGLLYGLESRWEVRIGAGWAAGLDFGLMGGGKPRLSVLTRQDSVYSSGRGKYSPTFLSLGAAYRF